MKILPNVEHSTEEEVSQASEITLETDSDVLVQFTVSDDALIWQTPLGTWTGLKVGVPQVVPDYVLQSKFFRLRVEPSGEQRSIKVVKAVSEVITAKAKEDLDTAKKAAAKKEDFRVAAQTPKQVSTTQAPPPALSPVPPRVKVDH